MVRRRLSDGDTNLEVQKPFGLGAGAEFVPYAPIDHHTDIDDFKAQGAIITEQRRPLPFGIGNVVAAVGRVIRLG